MSISVTHSVLSVGAAAPFRIIHLSDTHLTYADLRDGERKVKLIDWRLPSFPHAEAVLAEAGVLSKELNIPIFHTGHLHCNYEGVYAGRIPQIVTGCTDARVIEFT